MEELAIDIKDLETSFDGKKLIFAARVVPEPVNANLEFTTWNIWLFDFETMQALGKVHPTVRTEKRPV